MKSGGDIKRASRIRLLSREELALWRHVTADVKPRAKTGLVEKRVEVSALVREAPPAQSKTTAANKSGASEARPAPKPQAPTSTLAPLAPLERRLKRKLSSGRANVDDMIDLHGLTQADAHRALIAFLWRASDAGAKVVLVITGKGSLQNVADHHWAERGVLRRAAPQWLGSAALRSIVLSVEEAARTHGGEGALYVRLRRRLPERGKP